MHHSRHVSQHGYSLVDSISRHGGSRHNASKHGAAHGSKHGGQEGKLAATPEGAALLVVGGAAAVRGCWACEDNAGLRSHTCILPLGLRLQPMAM